MDSDGLLILGAEEVADLLAGRERDLVEVVSCMYEAHARWRTVVPHSLFLTLPDRRSRIIALAAYVEGERATAGVKWVSSFPDNVAAGLDRASAVVILNSATTGRPYGILEGSIINAKRTAASAALAARVLQTGTGDARLGLIGCGVINLEVARFILATLNQPTEALVLFDALPERAHAFRRRCLETIPEIGDRQVAVTRSLDSLLESCSLVSIATTALEPHIDDVSLCPSGTVILHISLRDIGVREILGCDNVVDDAEHVCRMQTSCHLAEQATGHRRFIRTTLGEILAGRAAARPDPKSVLVFSPFGLGALDLGVSQYTHDLALRTGTGVRMPGFLPRPWRRDHEAGEAAPAEGPAEAPAGVGGGRA